MAENKNNSTEIPSTEVSSSGSHMQNVLTWAIQELEESKNYFLHFYLRNGPQFVIQKSVKLSFPRGTFLHFETIASLLDKLFPNSTLSMTRESRIKKLWFDGYTYTLDSFPTSHGNPVTERSAGYAIYIEKLGDPEVLKELGDITL